MNNTFSLLIKKELTDNRKPILLGLVGIWGTFILLGGFLGYTGSLVAIEILLFIFFAVMLLSIGSSLAFSNMKTKEGRISTLMLPSTVAQKFMVRWIAAVPLLFAVVVMGCFFGDWSRMLMFRIMTHFNYYQVSLNPQIGFENQGMSGLDYISMNLAQESEPVTFLITTVVLGAMVVQAVYFLGAILWPKLSFIKTWAVTQALQIIGGIIFVMCIRFNLPNIKYVDISFGGFMCLYITIGLIICGALYWLAYLRYRRCEVIYKLF